MALNAIMALTCRCGQQWIPTNSGLRCHTERDIENWADGAGPGYELDRLRKRGRKPVGDGPGQVIAVRLDKTLLAALGGRADRDHLSLSAAIREAIRAYVG